MKKLLILFTFALVTFTASAQSCPDDNHPHAIDLGLPSGTLWACCNVGAAKPEDNGGHYAWGETSEKAEYTVSNYQFAYPDNNGDWRDEDSTWYSCQNIGYDIAGTQYDVAHVKWGESWQMPSLTQIQELLYKCSSQWTSINGVNGRLFTGPSGGTIFLPAAGYRWKGDLAGVGLYGDYWSSTQNPSLPNTACHLGFSSGYAHGYDSYYRYYGHAVRPVISIANDINLSESPTNTSSQAIFNLYGIKVADNADDIEALPSGIYIVAGKKMLIK